MKKQILIAMLGLVVSMNTFATTPEPADDAQAETETEQENQLPINAIPQVMKCTAVNAFGIAKLTLNPETQIIESVTNGFIKTKYAVVNVDAGLRTGLKAVSGKDYSMIVMKEPDALKSNHGYLLIFNQPLKFGAQRVSGHLASALLTDVAQSLFNPAMTVPLNYTPISTLSCDLVF